MGRTARILTWSAGIFVGLIALTVGAGYLFVTSDDFRSRVESGASAYSGRKTHIAKISSTGARPRTFTSTASRWPMPTGARPTTC